MSIEYSHQRFQKILTSFRSLCMKGSPNVKLNQSKRFICFITSIRKNATYCFNSWHILQCKDLFKSMDLKSKSVCNNLSYTIDGCPSLLCQVLFVTNEEHTIVEASFLSVASRKYKMCLLLPLLIVWPYIQSWTWHIS